MKNFFKFSIVILLFFLISCGKKSKLDRYPESDFPREYPVQNE